MHSVELKKIISTGSELTEIMRVLISVGRWYEKCGFRLIYLSLDSHLSPAACVAGLFLCPGLIAHSHIGKV